MCGDGDKAKGNMYYIGMFSYSSSKSHGYILIELYKLFFFTFSTWEIFGTMFLKSVLVSALPNLTLILKGLALFPIRST